VTHMVGLFSADVACVSAAPSVRIVDDSGKVDYGRTLQLHECNHRDRYVLGTELAQGVMSGKPRFLAPGGVLAHQVTTVLQSGGFDFANDLTQLFKIGVHGLIGTEPRAVLNWRHHNKQANRLQKELGLIYYRELLNLPKNYELEKVHTEVAGPIFAANFDSYLHRFAEEIAASSVRDSFRDQGVVPGFRAAIRVVKECPPKIAFRILVQQIANLPIGLVKRHAPRLFSKVRQVARGFLI